MSTIIVHSELTDLLQFFSNLLFHFVYLSVLIPGLSELTDKELVAKCTQKSADLQSYWREFKNRFDEIILAFIYREFCKISRFKFLDDYPEILKDLRQDVYIKLLNHDAKALKSFRGKNEASFRAFLNVIAKNLVLNYVKSDNYKKLIAKHKTPTEGDGIEVDVQALSMDTMEEIEKHIFQDFIIENIKTCFRSRNLNRDILLFKLFYFKGFTAREIATNNNFNLSPSGIESIVNRIVVCLRKNLKK